MCDLRLICGCTFRRYEGRVVAKLPFQPIGFISGLTHRSLLGDDMTDCSFVRCHWLSLVVCSLLCPCRVRGACPVLLVVSCPVMPCPVEIAPFSRRRRPFMLVLRSVVSAHCFVLGLALQHPKGSWCTAIEDSQPAKPVLSSRAESLSGAWFSPPESCVVGLVVMVALGHRQGQSAVGHICVFNISKVHAQTIDDVFSSTCFARKTLTHVFTAHHISHLARLQVHANLVVSLQLQHVLSRHTTLASNHRVEMEAKPRKQHNERV